MNTTLIGCLVLGALAGPVAHAADVRDYPSAPSSARVRNVNVNSSNRSTHAGHTLAQSVANTISAGDTTGISGLTVYADSNGVVTLVGSVQNAMQETEAVQLAQQTPGVRGVRDHLLPSNTVSPYADLADALP